MSNKRILFVGNTSWSMYNFRAGVMKFLQLQGFEIIVAAPEDEYSACFKSMGVKFIPVCMDNRGKNPFRDFSTFRALLRLYKGVKPDLVFHYTIKPNIYGTLACRVNGILSISVVTGLGNVYKKNGVFAYLISSAYRAAMSSNKVNIFLNEHDARFFIQNRIIKQEKSALFPGEGVNVDLFTPVKNRPDRKNIKFIFFSRLLKEKGIYFYIDAAREILGTHSNAEFYILGKIDSENPDSISEDEIKNWCDEGIAHYLGYSSKVQEVLQDMDCLIFPSFYNEGVPRVLLEVAGMEIPAITFNNVGCNEVIKDGHNGFVAERKNLASLIAKISHFISLSLDERRIMGGNSRKHVIERFSDEIIFARYAELIDKFL